jgi:hypothetical protein
MGFSLPVVFGSASCNAALLLALSMNARSAETRVDAAPYY